MNRKWLLTASLALLVSGLVGCSDDAGVPSGEYTGKIKEVNPDEKEIYVELDDGRVLELYFTDETALQQDGAAAAFDMLKEDLTVRVTVENVDGELKPKKVIVVPEIPDEAKDMLNGS